MLTMQSKYAIAMEPASFTNAATASLVIDTQGAFTGQAGSSASGYLTIDLLLGRSNNTSNTPSVIKLQECDTTVVTSFVDIAGSSFTSAFTSNPTAANSTLTWDVTLLPRKRYVKVVVSPVTTQIIAAVANLTRNEQAPPPTAANQGVAGLLVL